VVNAFNIFKCPRTNDNSLWNCLRATCPERLGLESLAFF